MSGCILNTGIGSEEFLQRLEQGKAMKGRKFRDYASKICLDEEIEDEEEDCGAENLSGCSFE